MQYDYSEHQWIREAIETVRRKNEQQRQAGEQSDRAMGVTTNVVNVKAEEAARIQKLQHLLDLTARPGLVNVAPIKAELGRLYEKQYDARHQDANARRGIGGAPTRATTLPEDAASRKRYPVASGVLDYFPDAIAAISRLSYEGNEQHNPGQPLHWARGKSGDESDTMMRHFLQRGTLDTDGQRHSVKLAWRALALLQKEIEAEREDVAQPVNYAAAQARAIPCFGDTDSFRNCPSSCAADKECMFTPQPAIECHGVEKDTHPQCKKCRVEGRCVNDRLGR